MASVKVLTKIEQKQTIKGIHKPKKNIIKNYLESPFALEWPQLTTTDEEEIVALIQKSCSGLREVECKPPWKQVSKYKGADRRSFVKEFRKKMQENLDPDSVKQMNKRKEALSHLIFGYNAVMRALEKDCVAAILVKKNVEPVFVTRTFLPGCAEKCIPLIPLKDLDLLLKDKETLALSHACMVLGLKLSVKQKSNLFHLLYSKMCKVLHVDGIDEDVSEEEPENSIEEDPRNDSSKCSYWLSETDIKVYYLSRNGTGRRTFIPSAPQMQTTELKCDDDFVSLKSFETQHGTHDADPVSSVKRKFADIQATTTAAAVDENIDFSSVILIDASGDENLLTESTNLKVKKVSNKDSHKPKRKAKRFDHDAYVPAKTKRLKGNPKRPARGK